MSSEYRVAIVYKPTQQCLDRARKISTLLRDHGYRVETYSVDDIIKENIVKPHIVVSIGGDGTLLKISRVFQHYTPLVLPIPCGRRTVLYEPLSEDMYGEIIDRLVKGYFNIEVMRRIRVVVENKEYIALNEALLISSDRGRVTGFEIIVKTLTTSSKYRFDGDGVMIGAPPGSAAYNLSAKGPLIDYGLDAMFITPLNPMELNVSTIIVPFLSKIIIRSRGYTELYIDGEKVYSLKPYTELYVESTDKNFRVIRFHNKDYVRDVYEKRRLVFD